MLTKAFVLCLFLIQAVKGSYELSKNKKEEDLADSCEEHVGKNRGATTDIVPKWTDRAEDGFIRFPYEIHSSFQSALAQRAIKLLKLFYQRYTCIKITPRHVNENINDTSYVKFIDAEGCSSWVGNWEPGQEISLNDPGCLQTIGVPIHEVLHALGFVHEQSRPDRDEHVYIITENIINGSAHNFDRYSEEVIDSFGSPYDVKSVMHYSSFAFTNNGFPTIVNVTDNSILNVQRFFFSKKDAEQVNLLYSCNGTNKDIRKPTDCYHVEDYGFSYRGDVFTPVSGDEECIPWESLTIDGIPLTEKCEGVLDADCDNNACRNYNIMQYDFPGCFISPNGYLAFAKCDIPECDYEPIPLVLPPNTCITWSEWQCGCNKKGEYKIMRTCLDGNAKKQFNGDCIKFDVLPWGKFGGCLWVETDEDDGPIFQRIRRRQCNIFTMDGGTECCIQAAETIQTYARTQNCD